MKIPANRVAVYLTSAAGLCTALAPAVANLDLTSTVGAVGGLAAVTAVVHKWLSGWQADEKAQAFLESGVNPNAYWSTASTTSATVKLEIPGQTEGVKAEGFLAPGEDAV